MVGGQFYNIRNDFIGFDWLSLRHSRQPIKLNLLLGPIGFEKIMSVSNKLINLLLGGSVVSYLVLNSILLFFMVIVY